MSKQILQGIDASSFRSEEKGSRYIDEYFFGMSSSMITGEMSVFFVVKV